MPENKNERAGTGQGASSRKPVPAGEPASPGSLTCPRCGGGVAMRCGEIASGLYLGPCEHPSHEAAQAVVEAAEWVFAYEEQRAKAMDARDYEVFRSMALAQSPTEKLREARRALLSTLEAEEAAS